MQNLKPTHFSAVADHPSAVSDVLDRVAGIAPAPLLPGEQEAEYATHVARIVAAAQPRDAIEDLLTRDVIDLSWEVLRLRRLKAGLLRGAISSSIYQVMCRLGYEDEYAWKLAANWAAGRKAAQKEVAGALQKAQLTMEDVMAETLEGKIDSFERFDRHAGKFGSPPQQRSAGDRASPRSSWRRGATGGRRSPGCGIP